MKRYQCIKTYRFGDDVPFTAGKLYNFVNVEKTDILEVVDNNGEAWTVDEYLAGHFQELLDLNVDDIDQVYADQEHLEYVMLQNQPGCTRGIALCLAAIATSGIIIYLALTWRS